MATIATICEITNPIKSVAGSTCSRSAVVPTAPNHQDRSAAIISQVYAIASTVPTIPPTVDRSIPSNSIIRFSAPGLNPNADIAPICRARCSTFKRISIATSNAAATMMKKLKPMNN